MPATVRTAKPRTTAEARLKEFIAKFDAKNAATIRAVRRALRKRFPTATEIVYDNYNFFVIGYSPTERPSDSIISMAAGANGVGLCFIHGARLPDPSRVLLGSGKQTRFVRLESVGVLERPGDSHASRRGRRTRQDAVRADRAAPTHHPIGVGEATTSPSFLIGAPEERNGQGEIRTLDTGFTGMPVFETGAFSHSATCPEQPRKLGRR